MARVSFRLTPKLRWNAAWQILRYNEQFQLFSYYENYHAHTGFTSCFGLSESVRPPSRSART